MKNRYSIILLLGIFLLAAALRMGWGGVNLFASDEARLSLVTLDMARQGDIARMGIQSSAGTRNLPASVYAFLPPYWISSDPLLASMYVGLLNALSVLGVGWLLYRTSGRNAALVAMFWLALNPTAVSYARSIWTQNLLMPLTTAWLLTAYLAIVTKKPCWRDALIALNLFIAGTAFQVHLAGASLILAALYVVLRFGWWRRWWAIIAGGIAAFLLLAPFLYHAQCCAPELVSEYFSAVGGDARAIDTQAAQFTLQIALGTDWAYNDHNEISLTMPIVLAGWVLVAVGVGLFMKPHPPTPSPPGEGEQESRSPTGSFSVDTMQLSPPSLNSAQHLATAVRGPGGGVRLLLELALVLLIATIAMFTYHSTPVRLHYMLGALPAIAVLIGIGFAAYRKPLNYLAAAPVIILSVLWLVQMLPALNQLQTSIEPGSAGSLLAAPHAVVQSIPAELPIVVHSASDDATTRGEPATWRVLLYDRPARVVNGWNMLVLPPEPTMLLSEDAAMPAWEELDAAGLLGDVQMLTPVENMATYYLMRYDGVAQPEGFNWLDSPVRFADGLALQAWKMRRVGDRLRVSMVYHVEALPAPATYQQFAHLRDAATLDAEQPLLVTDVALSQQNWRVGDTLIVMADFFPQAPATFWVDIGHYTLEQLGRIPRSDGAGDTIRLGSFDWQ